MDTGNRLDSSEDVTKSMVFQDHNSNVVAVPSCSPDTVIIATMESRKGGVVVADNDKSNINANIIQDANNNNQTTLTDDISSKTQDMMTSGSSSRLLRARSQRRYLQEKVRHNRQTLQDMARPLKQWLFQHRDNPYPTKAEKQTLAQGSQMTLTQVSNWFANARRRLKNTVKGENSWNSRIRHYNHVVGGNAELFSISSDDSIWDSEDEDNFDQSKTTFPSEKSQQPISGKNSDLPSCEEADLVPSRSETPVNRESPGREGCSTTFSVADDIGSHPKYKQTILQRYLSDAYQNGEHSVQFNDDSFRRPRGRRQSGSLGSRDYEEMSTSSASSLNRVFDDFSDDFDVVAKKRRRRDTNGNEDMYWKEISAAMALTTLARSRQQP